MSLLSIVQGAALRCNLPQPAAAFSSADPSIQLMIACAQDTGDEMVERWSWQGLKSLSFTFTGDGVTAAFALPAGITTLEPDLIMVSSVYPTLKMPGPVDEDDLLRAKAIPATIKPSMWRIYQNKVEFFPVLASGEVVSTVAQGAFWIKQSGGAQVAAWTADTDVAMFSERIVMLGAIFRWKRTMGLSYAEQKDEYELCFERKAGQEGTLRSIDMAPMTKNQPSTWPYPITDLTSKNY